MTFVRPPIVLALLNNNMLHETRIMNIKYVYKYQKTNMPFSICTSYVIHEYIYIIPTNILPGLVMLPLPLLLVPALWVGGT